MRRRLVASYLVIVGLALVAFTVPVGLQLTDLLRSDQREVALREARTIAVLLATATEADDATARGARVALLQLRDEMEEQTDGRVELIGVDRSPALGRPVVGADDGDFDAALSGQERVRSLDDSVLGERGLQVTVPATTDDGRVDGAVRVTVPTAPVDEEVRGIWLFRLAAGAVVLVLSVIASAVVATSLLRPLRLLDAMADRISRGDLTARADLDAMGPPEMRRLASTLNDGTRRIEVLLSAQRAFTADASHQLRTPLTALRLGLENLQDRLDDPADVAAVDRALSESGRLSRLVSDLLVLARSQGASATPVPVDVGAVLEARAEVWSSSAEDVGARIVVELGGPGVGRSGLGGSGSGGPGLVALASSGQLEQALDNLIDNALRVCPTGEAVTLRATAPPEADAVLVEVIDRGPGMSAADRARAFDRFWSTTPGGSGLGLAIARELVQHDGGSVDLVDTPGGGLTARLVLPRDTAATGGDRAG
ncbi:sensor histidine kinase [Frigoribacterium sp. R86507]|uniref:sensor histidine kinase n=1 Tax=Frigoribacterium sp. R86507 TaxID=3093850 RepID=UPI0037CAFB87